MRNELAEDIAERRITCAGWSTAPGAVEQRLTERARLAPDDPLPSTQTDERPRVHQSLLERVRCDRDSDLVDRGLHLRRQVGRVSTSPRLRERGGVRLSGPTQDRWLERHHR